MDPGRYGHHQGWENNSDFEGYGSDRGTNIRDGGSYGDRRFMDERFSRENVYPEDAIHHDVLDRGDYHAPPSPVGMWSQSRRKSYEDDYSYERDYRRHEKPPARFGSREREEYGYNDYDYQSRFSHESREDSREREYEYGRQNFDAEYDRDSRRNGSWRRRSRDREWDKGGLSRERGQSPYRKNEHSPSRSRSRSRGYDDRLRSRSPRGRSHFHGHREDSYDDNHHDGGARRRDREVRRQHDHYSVAPSATVVIKGLSHKTTEEDLHQILAEWGPLRHVRVIKERNSGASRGFAFIDFPSKDSAQAMMDRIGREGLLVDGRSLFFEYSRSNGNEMIGMDESRYGNSSHRSIMIPCDWMCTICGCINFARRTSCFQCNEPKTEDAPPADMSSSHAHFIGKRDGGPTHVLVVRGLDENADEEMLRYEFSKHAPIKDLRLVRDKFTHVSRGFAFVHFFSVNDATKALEVTNGTTLDKNGQTLRVAYAKSIVGPGSAASGSQSSSLAAAAIEAATFAQQYDAVGWVPKEYNPEDKQPGSGQEQHGQVKGQMDHSAPHSGFVWDEASGYYFDAASGFYYDGNTGFYYDGNAGIWYSYDQHTQQYVPCTDQNDGTSGKPKDTSKPSSDGPNNKKVIISAPAATLSSNEKALSLPDAVKAAASAAIAAEKKEKERQKEIKLASKSSILANKKKINNVLSMWKQRSSEGQAPSISSEDRSNTPFAKSKSKNEGVATVTASAVSSTSTFSTGGALKGVIRSSGMGSVKSDTIYAEDTEGAPSGYSSQMNIESSTPLTSFRTDSSALSSYAPSSGSRAGKRRFSEMPSASVVNKEQPQTTYRDRAAERRNLYGSSQGFVNDTPNAGDGDSNGESGYRRGAMDSMPFPPGVGGGRSYGVTSDESYDVITSDMAIDESNLGNRMLRNMGWHEGSGLGKDGSGVVEPVVAHGIETRAGLGSHQQKKAVDPSLEVQAGDSYKAVIQKKAIARFREMS